MSVDTICFPLLVTCTILHVEDFIVSGIVILHLLKEHLAYYLYMSQNGEQKLLLLIYDVVETVLCSFYRARTEAGAPSYLSLQTKHTSL